MFYFFFLFSPPGGTGQPGGNAPGGYPRGERGPALAGVPGVPTSHQHQCLQCLKGFSSSHQLTQHTRIHTGEKPYKCSFCDRRFKQLSHVQQHTRLHTGLSTFLYVPVKYKYSLVYFLFIYIIGETTNKQKRAKDSNSRFVC